MSKSWLGLEEKVIVITGGASGIGAQLSKTLQQEGAVVVIADHNVDTGEMRDGACCVRCDVIRRESAEEMVRIVTERFGRLDALVNCVGAQSEKVLLDEEHPERELDEVTFAMMWGVNVKSVYICSQAAARRMKQQGGGTILNICVSSGEGQSVYAAMKGAVQGLTQGWAGELERYSIRVVGCTAQGTAANGQNFQGVLAALNGAHAGAAMHGRSMGQEGESAGLSDLAAYLLSDKAEAASGTIVEIQENRRMGSDARMTVYG